MIVLIVGEGHWLVDDALAGTLNELRTKLEASIERDDEVGFRSALAELRGRAHLIGRPVASDLPRAFDLIVPPHGAAMDVTRRLLGDKAPPAESWAWFGDQQPARVSAGSGQPDLVVRTRRSEHQLRSGTTYRIGRDPKSNIVMTDSRVSWRHAVLRVDGDRWVLEDIGSTNGTFLRLQRLDRIEISGDCVVRLGSPDDGPVLRLIPQVRATALSQEVVPEAAHTGRVILPSSSGGAASPPACGPGRPPPRSPADPAPPEPAAAYEAPGPREDAPQHAAAAPTQPVPSSAPAPLSASGTGAFPAVAGLVAYDTLVRGAFAETVHPGRLLFNPPDRMRLGQTERVEVRLARALTFDGELLEHLRGHGEPRLEEVPTAPLMAVTLKGDGFRIEAYSDEEQIVALEGITTWEFDICALKRGLQRLVICVSLRIPLEGRPFEHKSIPVRESTIDVQVGAPALIGHFVASNWQWFIGTAIAIAAVLVAVLH